MNLLLAAGNADTGEWFEVPSAGNVHHSHVRTIFVQGTLGGATVTIEGSAADDGANPLTAPTARQTSTVTTISALGLTNISARIRQIRAKTSGGSGTDLDVILV